MPRPALRRREDGTARYLMRWLKEGMSTAERMIRRIVLYITVRSLLSCIECIERQLKWNRERLNLASQPLLWPRHGWLAMISTAVSSRESRMTTRLFWAAKGPLTPTSGICQGFWHPRPQHVMRLASTPRLTRSCITADALADDSS